MDYEEHGWNIKRLERLKFLIENDIRKDEQLEIVEKELSYFHEEGKLSQAKWGNGQYRSNIPLPSCPFPVENDC